MAEKEYPFSRNKEEMLIRHRGLIEATVRHFSFCGAPEDDLRQEAELAFCNAVDLFDENKKNKFASYVVECMRGRIKNFLTKFLWQRLKVPTNIMAVVQKILHKIGELEKEYGRVPTLSELSDRWGIPINQLEKAFDALANLRPLSLSEEVGEGLYLEDVVAVTNDEVERVDLCFDIEKALEQIPDNYQIILRRLLEGATLTQIAKEQGCSHQNIHRKARQAGRCLAEHLSIYDQVHF